jgi:hypothetical protein
MMSALASSEGGAVGARQASMSRSLHAIDGPDFFLSGYMRNGPFSQDHSRPLECGGSTPLSFFLSFLSFFSFFSSLSFFSLLLA